MNTHVAVVIAGGGPAGLCLAIELGLRSVPCVLLDDKPDTTRHPAANATQARTMEHFRRMGVAREIRAQGLPPDYPTDIAYFTRYAGRELARFRLPPAAQAQDIARQATGSWSTPELPHRCSQMYIERILKRRALEFATNDIRYGWRVAAFRDLGTRVEVDAKPVGGTIASTITCDFLVGCDGARSMVREALGIRLEGEGTASRNFMGGAMLAAHIRSADLYRVIRGERAWMYWAFNPQRRAFMPALNGTDEFVFHTQLGEREAAVEVTEAQVRAMVAQAVDGERALSSLPRAEFAFEVLYTARWNAGYTLVAQAFGRGRVFLAGDAAHLFTPTGGLGYNTAVDDAVNLGWKLAATLQGWGGPRLLASYEAERRPSAQRNTRIARGFADSIGNFAPHASIEDDSAEGERAREEAGRYLLAHAEREFNIPGVTLGVRYDVSPIIAADGAPPEDLVNEYRPSGVPGGRAPHLWIGDASLYDRFGREFTLLRLGGASPADWQGAATKLGMPLATLDLAHLPQARELYGADLALIRPDQHIAWRGAHDSDPDAALARASGCESS